MTIGERTATINVSASVTSGNSFGGSASLPTGTASGEYTIAAFFMQGTSIATPSGWTSLMTAQNIDSTETMAVFGRQWSGSPAVPTTTSNGTGRATLILHTITGADATTQPDVATHTSNYAGSGLTTYTDSGVTTVTQGCLAVSVAMVDSSTRTWTLNTAGWNLLAATTGADGGRGAAMGSKAVGAAGSTGTVSWSVSGAGIDGTVATLAFRPASVSVTGTSTSTTTITGNVDKGIGFDGTAASTSSISGAVLGLGAAITGTRASTSTGSGTLNLGRQLAAAAASTSSITGALTVQSRVHVGTLEIELEPGTDVWTDFTTRLDMRSGALTVKHGRPTPYDDVGAATLTCGLFNDDGAITPDNPSAATPLVEGMRLRWTVSQSGNDYVRFFGWISELVPDFPGESTIGARVAVTAVDALGLLGQRKLRSNWTELALAAARTAGTTGDAFEAAGTAIGWQAILTNYSTDAVPGVGSYAYSGSLPNLSFTSDRDTSVGPVVSASPDSDGNTNTAIVVFGSTVKSVQWLVKTPTQLPAAGTPWVISSVAVSVGTNLFNIACEDNGAGNMRLIVSNAAGSSSLGTLLNPVCHGQWVMIKVTQNASTSTRLDVTATQLGDGTSGTVSNINLDLQTATYLEFPSKVGANSACALGGVIGFGSRTVSLGYTEATVLGAQGAVSSRLADLQSAVDELPITWATSGTLDVSVVTGTWSSRTALEVLQELMRSNALSVAWARPRDSTIYAIGYDVVRPSTVLATVDTDADCAGQPRLSRAQSTRPTRVQVDAPGISVVQVDADAEAGPGNPQRLKTLTTVVDSSTNAQTIGDLVLQQRTRLRITQMTVDLTAGATDHTATLFSEAGALSGLFPTCRIRAVVPSSHFGVQTRDYAVQGWTETYSARQVTVTIDTDPCPTTTLVAETFTAANGTNLSTTSFPTSFGDATTGATFDVQSNRARIVSGGTGNQAGKRTASTYADVEITGTVRVTGSAEAQVWWRMDSTGANGYGLVFSASGGVRVQQAVAGVLSTRYSAADVGGPTIVAATDYSLRIRHVGQYLAVKAWDSAGSEPLAWGLLTTDSLFTAAGYVGLANWGTSTTSNFDTVTVTDGS
jgi:hypothetical protein